MECLCLHLKTFFFELMIAPQNSNKTEEKISFRIVSLKWVIDLQSMTSWKAQGARKLSVSFINKVRDVFS